MIKSLFKKFLAKKEEEKIEEIIIKALFEKCVKERNARILKQLEKDKKTYEKKVHKGIEKEK